MALSVNVPMQSASVMVVGIARERQIWILCATYCLSRTLITHNGKKDENWLSLFDKEFEKSSIQSGET
jgi:hypothetical protein